MSISPSSSIQRLARALAPAILLAVAVSLSYLPALEGSMLWDDEGHITKVELRSLQGLKRIWLDVGATQQYYPLLHTAFWLQHRLFGDNTSAYHAVTMLLHVCCALLAAAILRYLKAPGALLAATVFALHPVHVESVAWISEQKNTLSGAFFLASLLIYLRFDESRRIRHYIPATILFVLALLSKTTTATLPAALLLIAWWRRGRLSVDRDVLPLAPWFVLATGAGLFTAWVEQYVIGATGVDFGLSFIQRLVIAGRAVFFYAGTLLWPAQLAFNYPRWEIPRDGSWQILIPVALAALVTSLSLVRRYSRAPLTVLLYYCVTLLPVLGFFNVYPFTYSFVADHFQYLASLGPISLFSAGVTRLLEQRMQDVGKKLVIVGLSLAVLLGAMSWRLSHQYSDLETLYRETLKRNPRSWLAAGNLCSDLTGQKRYPEAIQFCTQAMMSNPEASFVNNSMGKLLAAMGRIEDAIPFFQETTRLNRQDFLAFGNVSLAMLRTGRAGEAVVYGKEAARLNPNDALVQETLCLALASLGRFTEAEVRCRNALRLDPTSADAHANLGAVLGEQQAFEEAVLHFKEALRLSPEGVNYLNALGVLLGRQGNCRGASDVLEAAMRHRPNSSEIHNNLGLVRECQGRIPEAIEHYREALRLKPENLQASQNLQNALMSQHRD